MSSRVLGVSCRRAQGLRMILLFLPTGIPSWGGPPSGQRSWGLAPTGFSVTYTQLVW